MENIQVGKWYKNPNWCCPDKDFVKASEQIEGSSSIYFSEHIRKGEYFNGNDSWRSKVTCIEASPEEYSKYLPDGHPDKRSIVVGAWYKHNSWASNDFVKITKLGHDSIFFSEKIDGGRYSSSDGEWGTGIDKPTTCTRADVSEYGVYLPDGHADKLNTTAVAPWQKYSGRYAKVYGKYLLLGVGRRNGMYECVDETGNKTELDVHWSGDEAEVKVELMPEGWVLEASKSQFEVGNWYKNIGGSKQFYVKYDRMDGGSVSGDCIDITCDRFERNSVVSRHFDSAILVTDISEIQKYLPDGHVDKIKQKSHNFVVGKWYASTHWRSFKAAKFLELSTYGEFTFSETIRLNGKHEVNKNTTGTDSQIWSSFTEVDVQEYLPDGHPDKKVVITVGKWYKYKNPSWSTRRDFCKATNSRNGDLYFSEKIHQGVYAVYDSLWGDSSLCVEATPEEYSQYLPDGHPDKIVTLEKGCWYSCIAYGKTWFYKFNVLNDFGAITASEFIDDSGRYTNGFGTFGRIDEYTVKLLPDLSVIQPFLPEGHVDKIYKIITNSTYGFGEPVVMHFGVKAPKVEDTGELKLIKSKKLEIKLVN